MADDLAGVTRPPEPVTLDQIRFTVQEQLRAHGVGGTVRDTITVELAGRAAVAISGVVLAERLPPLRCERSTSVGFRSPAGWWEAFRHQYRYRWWMRRWVARRPVRMNEDIKRVTLVVDVTRSWTFPRAQVLMPALGEPVRVGTAEPRWRIS